MKSQVRYGILGTGRIAATMAPYFRQSGNSEVCAVAASTGEKAAAFAGKFKIGRSYGDYAALLKDEHVDAVYVALPNSLHYEYCRQALELGKHVLCEKTFVLESRQADELAALAKKKNLKIMECFWYRFHPLADLVAKSIKLDLGTPLGFYSTFSFASAAESDIRWKPELGGGALYDLMCYNVDALNYFFNPDLSEMNYLEAFSRQRNGVDANLNVEALFPDEFQVMLSSSIDRQSVNRTTIVGTAATLVIPNLRMSPDIKESFFYLLKDGQKRKIEAGTFNAYIAMVKAFSGAVINDGPVPVSIRDSRKNIILLEKIKAGMKIEMADRVALFPKAGRKLKNLLLKVKRKWA